MLKFSSRNEVEPGFRIVGAEDVEICFNFLIGVFSLPMSLRVVGSGEFDIVLEESGQLPREGRGKLGSSI